MENTSIEKRSRKIKSKFSPLKRSAVGFNKKQVTKMDDTEKLLEGTEEETDNSGSERCCPTLTWLSLCMKFLYVCFYITLYLIALHYEFGTVYLIISTLFLIWWNTGTKPKKEGEVSAYSVFNPNCERIDGTFTAEQLEKEMFYGPAAAVTSR